MLLKDGPDKSCYGAVAATGTINSTSAAITTAAIPICLSTTVPIARTIKLRISYQCHWCLLCNTGYCDMLLSPH